MPTPRIFLSPPDVSEIERQYLLDAFDSNWISPLGPHVDAFEREFAALSQVEAAVALSSGTAALHLGLKALGVGPGDTVLVATLTFAASANPVTYLGATPAFIDVSPETWTLDPLLLWEELDARAKQGRLPKAVMTVDLYGQCCDYEPILAVCNQHNIPVIADAAEAVGAVYKGRPAGGFGACAAFSFNGNKIITTGGGGMFVSNDAALAARIRYLSTQARDPAPHYQHAEVGFNYRMSNLLAAVGRGQLSELGSKITRRRQIRERYEEAFGGHPGVSFMPEAPYGRSNCWLTCMVVDPARAGVSREDLRLHLESLDIESRPVWKPMHLQPAFAHCDSRGGDVARGLFEHGLCLPSGSSLTERDQRRVIDALGDAFAGRRLVAPKSESVAEAEAPQAAPVPARVIVAPHTPPMVRLKRLVLRAHRVLSVTSQILVMAVTYWAAFMLRFDGAPPEWAWRALLTTMPVLIALRIAVFVPMGLFQGLWRHTSFYDFRHLAKGVGLSTLLFTVFIFSPLSVLNSYPRSILVIDATLVLLMLIGLRMARRVYGDMRRTYSGDLRPVLIYGAGSAGGMVAHEMKSEPELGYRPVGFIDDDPAKKGRRIHGLPVFGGRDALSAIVAKVKPAEILVAMPSADAAALSQVVRSLGSLRVPIKALPPLKNLIGGRDVTGQRRTIAIEDLIPRAPSDLDAASIQRFFEGQSVLVTGAAGHVGAELCRQLLRLRPASLTLVDRHEGSLHEIWLELDSRRSPVRVHPVLADITDRRAIETVIADSQPTLIIHAAGVTHRALIERSPSEAMRNNVDGARIVAEVAAARGVPRLVLLSTFKAAAPKSVLGRSKRLAEAVMLSAVRGSATALSVIRFGNILGSPGSVVPRFLSQIQNGGPVTVTDPLAERHFVLLSDAAHMVLHTVAHTEGGVTYALDMGQPVRILDLAENLIRLAGLAPGGDISISFTGLRDGEQLTEDLVGADERLSPSGVPRVWRVELPEMSPAEVAERLETLAQVAS